MRQQERQPHERHAARGSDFRTGWLRSWVWRSSSSLGFFVGQIDVLVPGCCEIAPNPQARVVDSCSTSSRTAVTLARKRTQLAANQGSAADPIFRPTAGPVSQRVGGPTKRAVETALRRICDTDHAQSAKD